MIIKPWVDDGWAFQCFGFCIDSDCASCGGRYIAMLMTGWGVGAEEKDLLDVGWLSVWVKLVSQWLTTALYLWTLVAPALFPDRVFS